MLYVDKENLLILGDEIRVSALRKKKATTQDLRFELALKLAWQPS